MLFWVVSWEENQKTGVVNKEEMKQPIDSCYIDRNQRGDGVEDAKKDFDSPERDKSIKKIEQNTLFKACFPDKMGVRVLDDNFSSLEDGSECEEMGVVFECVVWN